MITTIEQKSQNNWCYLQKQNKSLLILFFFNEKRFMKILILFKIKTPYLLKTCGFLNDNYSPVNCYKWECGRYVNKKLTFSL